MNENTNPSTKQFEQTDLDKIKTIQSKLDGIIVNLGQISAQEAQLEESKIILKQELVKSREEESTLAKELSNKYGIGTLDIESGKFTPQT